MNQEQARILLDKYLLEHPTRYRHSLETATLSSSLAKVHQVDTEKATVAALLHDITKFMPYEEAKSLSLSYYSLEDVMNRSKDTIHALSCVALLRKEYHVEDIEILGPIEHHTTGKAAMTTLEKILFVADYAEPSRPFPNQAIRELAFVDLDQAVLESLLVTKQYLEKHHIAIESSSIQAISYYQKRLGGIQ